MTTDSSSNPSAGLPDEEETTSANPTLPQDEHDSEADSTAENSAEIVSGDESKTPDVVADEATDETTGETADAAADEATDETTGETADAAADEAAKADDETADAAAGEASEQVSPEPSATETGSDSEREAPRSAAPKTPSFTDLALPDAVLAAVTDAGYEAPSPIQVEAIPPLLEGRDLLGQAQTGTGKTAAFTLPLLARLDLGHRRPQALVLTPTRELAIQVAEAMQTYARHLRGFHVVPVYGGQSIDIQLRHLRRGAHVVVGTPGRIQDHLRRRTLGFSDVATVVLDEADEMLRMGFLDDVQQILDHTPEDKQVALFSATMPHPIRQVARKYLRNPREIKIASRTATVASVSQRYWRVMGVNKLHALTRILEVEDFEGMLVFVRTKLATVELAEKLEARGFAAAPLNGDMNQSLRERTVERLRSGKLDIVVATDVAARGLDVDRISHVVNFDMPYDVESYVHRIGRTGRAGREGNAILFVSPRERSMLFTIQRVTGQTIEKMYLPSRKQIADHRVARFKLSVAESIETQDLDRFGELIEEIVEESGAELSMVAAALAYLAQRERPLDSRRDNAQTEKARPSAPRESETRSHHDRRPPRQGEPPRERPRPDDNAGSFARQSDGGGAPRPGERDTRRPPADRRGDPRAERGGSDRQSFRWQRYRIEVGREDGVQPGNIVGAISNEAELDGQHIGAIKIFDTFSLVELPEGMPHDTFEHLQRVRVRGRELRISEDRGGGGAPRRRPAPGPRGAGEGRPRDDYERGRYDGDSGPPRRRPDGRGPGGRRPDGRGPGGRGPGGKGPGGRGPGGKGPRKPGGRKKMGRAQRKSRRPPNS